MSTTLDVLGPCPKCGESLIGADIFETLRQQKWCEDKSDDELRDYVQRAYAPPYRFSRLVMDREANAWVCPSCSAQFPVFQLAPE